MRENLYSNRKSFLKGFRATNFLALCSYHPYGKCESFCFLCIYGIYVYDLL